MRQSIYLFLLVAIASCADPAPSDNKPDLAKPDSTKSDSTKTDSTKIDSTLIKKVEVTGIEPATANSGETVRIKGKNFVKRLTVTLSGRQIVVDSIFENEIVFRAPWPRSTYTVEVRDSAIKHVAGNLEVIRPNLASVDIEDGFYAAVEIKGSGIATSSGWSTQGSNGATYSYHNVATSPSTEVMKDDIPWIEIVGDSLICRAGSFDASYGGVVDRGSAEIRSFGGRRSTGSGSSFSFSTQELEVVDLGSGKYLLRARGNFAFRQISKSSASGPPRPSQGETTLSPVPSSIFEVILEKKK